MTTVLYAWPYSIYIEIQNNLRREKLHRTNQGSKFLGSSFSNKDNIRPQSNLEEKVNPNIFKDEFSSQTLTLSKCLDKSSPTAWVALDLLKALAILSDTTVRRSTVDREDLKPY